MRAWKVTRYGEPAEVLSLLDGADSPEPGPGAVKIRVEAAGLGLPDVFMCRNVYPLTPPLPFVPSQEAAGEIVAVGDGVDEAAIGRRVFGMTQFQEGCGGLAEECLLSSELAFDIPEGMSSEEAAGFWIPYWTAWFGLVVRGRVSANDTVLVLGATGSSGTAAVQLAKAIGAARVIAVAGGEQKCRFCQELGADAVIDHQKQDITAATRVLTGGRGVDVVYDPVGGEPGRAAFLATAFEGRFVLIGFAAGDWPRIDLLETLFPNISLLGSTPSLEFGPEVHRDAYERLACFWQQGRLKHSASHVFDFSEGRGAIEHIAARRVQGKVVVSVR